ncbi:hypothetical protein C7G41_29080 [Bradyrhizobium sp. MOS002]|nr:hypothetical protein C7G41_29080 [Bradyrhizobium sp. MOS002]
MSEASGNNEKPIFTMEIDGKPVIAFGAENFAEARELCREQWLKDDLAGLTSGGVWIYKEGAKLQVRRATVREVEMYGDAERSVEAADALMIAYLVDLDDMD